MRSLNRHSDAEYRIAATVPAAPPAPPGVERLPPLAMGGGWVARMCAAGKMDAAAARAAAEIAHVVETSSGALVTGAAIAAIDPMRIKVDGGRGWSGGVARLAAASGAVHRVARWRAEIAARQNGGGVLAGRKDKIAVDEMVSRVILGVEPPRGMDVRLGLYNGAVARSAVRELRLYAETILRREPAG